MIVFKPLQLVPDVRFAAAEPVEGLDDQGVPGAQDGRFKRLIAGTVQILAGFLVCDDLTLLAPSVLNASSWRSRFCSRVDTRA